jgi:hypothetical protein
MNVIAKTAKKTYSSMFIEIQTLAIAHGAEVDSVDAIASLRTDLTESSPCERVERKRYTATLTGGV